VIHIRKFSCCVSLIALLHSIGCGGGDAPEELASSPVDAEVGNAQSFSPQQQQAYPSPIPGDVDYTIVSDESLRTVKRTIEIRLNKRVSQSVLRSIAMTLHSSNPSKFERAFIGYHVDGVETGGTYWATTHFNPNLDIRILGLTDEEADSLSRSAKHDSRNVIGNWIDDSPSLGKKTTIYRDGGKMFMDLAYKDGSIGTKVIRELQSPLGRRFQTLEDSIAGDHWIIDSDGNLQLHDDEGWISTANKID
jgi:hypothetical protein